MDDGDDGDFLAGSTEEKTISNKRGGKTTDQTVGVSSAMIKRDEAWREILQGI